jgi:predicted RNase H-like HicB family nuclease
MKIDFELILTEKNGKFIAQCPQFPKQKGIGATEREALESLAKAISGAVENAMGKIMKEVFSSGLGEMQDKILDKIDTKIDETDSAPEIKSPKKLNSANKRKMILSTQLGQVGSNNLLFNDLLNFAKGSFLDAGGSQPPQNGSQPSLFNRSSLGLGAGFGLDSKGSHTPKPRPMMPYLIETGLGDGFIIAIPLSSN